MLKLYNTLTRKKEKFEPIDQIDKKVGLYVCGPTVYNYAHIGNLRSYIGADILRRVLKYSHYKVTHVMNLTDVGHLTDDADQGVDKMEKSSAQEGKSAAEIAEFYTIAFKKNLQDLNILEPTIWCKATDHITEQIQQTQELINRGFTYETADGIYFDTTKVKDYGKLAQLDKQTLNAGARVDMGYKKNPHDFALWKFSKENEKRQMEWNAFGHKGFPGWHIECSAMSMKYLGDQFDIHFGGIDHIPVHHTNEIAQAESITGLKPWVKYWLHNEFLIINDSKMSKSEGNFVTLQTLKEKGFSPLAYRYLILQTHYRKQLNFTWDALEAAQNGLNNLKDHIKRINEHDPNNPSLEEKFLHAINDDLNIPEALALIWGAIKTKKINLFTVMQLDKVLGLNLHEPEEKMQITPEIQSLLDNRKKARAEKNWAESDELRLRLEQAGFRVEDTSDDQKLYRL